MAVNIALVSRFAQAIGLDAAQALSMLSMSYQVRPIQEGEKLEKISDHLYLIPDICMGKSSDCEEYRVTLPGYLLDASMLDENAIDFYLETSLQVARDYLIQIMANIRMRYNNVGIEYFSFLVSKASCVPSNYQKQFAKGLYYGYLGDFHTASCLLVPLIERFVRGLCTANKIPIADKNGKPLGLGGLLNKQDTTDLFSTGVYFEIKALLSGTKGLNLRNILAHGSITDEESEGVQFFYMWWFALRMVVNLRMVDRVDGTLSDIEKKIIGKRK